MSGVTEGASRLPEKSDSASSDAQVLVIDDDCLIRRYLRSYLKREGYGVLESEGGSDGVALAMECVPSLIILDYLMPDMDGKQVLRRLKENMRTRNIPVIVLTSVKDMDLKLSFFRLGAADFLTKPFSKEEVVARVRAHIQLVEINRLKVLVEFSGASAHELRQPLSALYGFVELIRMGLHEDQEELLEYLKGIEESVDRMARLIRRMEAVQEYRTKRYLGEIDILDFE